MKSASWPIIRSLVLSMLSLSALLPIHTAAQAQTNDFPGIGVMLPGGGVNPQWVDEFLDLDPQQAQPLASPAPTLAPTLSPPVSPVMPQHPTEPPLVKPTPTPKPSPVPTKKPLSKPVVTKKPIPVVKKPLATPVQPIPKPTVLPAEAEILYATFPVNTSMDSNTDQNNTNTIYVTPSPNPRVIIPLGVFACLLLIASVVLVNTVKLGKKASPETVLIHK